jgi:hypothetical protein
MSILSDKGIREAEEQAVTQFFSSLAWQYLAHRYPWGVQGHLLRLLTLSGLPPRCWSEVSGEVVSLAISSWRLTQGVTGVEEGQSSLRQVVEKIWRMADAVDILVGLPPRYPVYLMAYGYSQSAYLADLHQIYGQALVPRYEQAWPPPTTHLQRQPQQTAFVDQAVAMMGTTARMIDWLVEKGRPCVDENERNEQSV